MTLRFSPGWKMTLFTGGFLPVLVTLGLWQLDRETEKIALQALYDFRQDSPAQPVSDIDWSETDLSYQKVQVTGQFDNERYFLLDNRIQGGRVGYEVLMPFISANGEPLILNRGWIAQGETRAQLPELEPVLERVSVVGSIYVPLSEPFMLSNIPETSASIWPLVVQKIDISEWSNLLELPLPPFSVRLAADSPGALQVDWQTINMLPEKHRGYAVQWFTMALALLVMYLYYGTRNPTNREIDE